jgi:hypothetical protein
VRQAGSKASTALAALAPQSPWCLQACKHMLPAAQVHAGSSAGSPPPKRSTHFGLKAGGGSNESSLLLRAGSATALTTSVVFQPHHSSALCACTLHRRLPQSSQTGALQAQVQSVGGAGTARQQTLGQQARGRSVGHARTRPYKVAECLRSGHIDLMLLLASLPPQLTLQDPPQQTCTPEWRWQAR